MKFLKTTTIALMLMIGAMGVAKAETTGDSMAGFGGYSEGYRMGKITKFSVKGMLVDSGEGQIHLGKDSDVWQVKGKDGVETKNPWAFSSSKNAADVIAKYQGKYVWVKYQQSMVGLGNRDTSYSIVEIAPVTKTSPACKAESHEGGMKSSGARSARVVKAAAKGVAIKTWEIDLHMGGRDFISMSTSDEDIYKCAVEWLKSGKEVNVHYVQKMMNLSFNDTDYRIVKIEPADDLD